MIRWNMEKRAIFHSSQRSSRPTESMANICAICIFIHLNIFVRKTSGAYSKITYCYRDDFDLSRRKKKQQQQKERKKEGAICVSRNSVIVVQIAFAFALPKWSNNKGKQQQRRHKFKPSARKICTLNSNNNNNNFFKFVHCTKQFTHLLFSSLRPT